jgi:hypothetical protein
VIQSINGEYGLLGFDCIVVGTRLICWLVVGWCGLLVGLVQDKEAWTPLHLASRFGLFDICHALLQSPDLSINQKNSHGLNAFAYVIQNKPNADEVVLYGKLLQQFVHLGSNLSLKYVLPIPSTDPPSFLDTAITHQFHHHHPNHPTHPNHPNHPNHHHTHNGSRIRMMLGCRTRFGDSPLHSAAIIDNEMAVRVMLENSVYVDIRNRYLYACDAVGGLVV